METTKRSYRIIRKTAEKRYGVYLWEVECPYCGKVYKQIKSRIGKKHGKSCGCLRKPPWTTKAAPAGFKIIRQFSEKRPGSSKRNIWEVECPFCGAPFKVLPHQLGKTVFSCGCVRFRDYTGEYVNYLYVVRKIGYRRRRTQSYSLYECVCTYQGCGMMLYLDTFQLCRKPQSCGCKTRLDRTKRFLDKYKEPK